MYPKCCLLIEDDEDDKFILMQAISELFEDVYIRTAYDAENAFSILLEEKFLPELIILDINLPKMNGLECLQRLREFNETRHIPVVIYSTSVEGINRTGFDMLKIHKVVKKPDTFDGILKEVDSIFRTI